MVHYHSSGFRLNPNLYECGKVCLSLLNTWTGGRDEMWLPNKSTMLQVLVSIQALILNAEPFFNEPGYEKTYKGQEGRKRSKEYSEDIFIKSLKKMMYTIRNPPQVWLCLLHNFIFFEMSIMFNSAPPPPGGPKEKRKRLIPFFANAERYQFFVRNDWLSINSSNVRRLLRKKLMLPFLFWGRGRAEPCFVNGEFSHAQRSASN